MSQLRHSTGRAAFGAIGGRLAPYLLALAIVLVSVGLRSWLGPVSEQVGAAIVLGSVLIAAWFGGLGPGLVALVLMHVAHVRWFSDPPRPMWGPDLASTLSTGAYYLVTCMIGMLSDMRSAAQRRASEQQQEAVSQRENLRATLTCIADGVIVTDVKGRLTLMNPAAEQITGWNIVDAAGKPWWEIMAMSRQDGGEGVESPIHRALHEGHIVHETMPLVLTSRTGRTIPIAYSAAPVRDSQGQVTGVVLVVRDETERRRTELALRNADRRKDEFLATLAHELRNPLAPISMGLELLKLSEDDPSAAEEIRVMMLRQSQHMVRLIDDLLDVSRITRGKLELRRTYVELDEIIRNAVDATRPFVDDAGHQLSVQLPGKRLLLYADANRLTQVFTNLLNNAAKYTPREGQIDLKVEFTGIDAIVTISDTGIGIPAEKLDSVFEMFTQVNATSETGHTGLGIGLTLVKRLVEMHGGKVEVQSRGRNLGTSVRVCLPALPQPALIEAGTLLKGPSQPAASRRKVLVVDDNADALESLSRLVAVLGNEVCKARDGVEALEATKEFRPDIVLMDLGMPNMNGYEAARRIRQQPWGRELVLVATTGWGQEEDRRRTAEAGFNRHLVKPIEAAMLRRLLEDPSLTKSPASVMVGE
jgi:PAS domain S-box-containing protein